MTFVSTLRLDTAGNRRFSGARQVARGRRLA